MLKDVPEGWRRVRLGDECDVLLGATPPRKQDEYWDTEFETENQWVSIADLTALSGSRIYETSERISDLGIENSSVKLIEPGVPIMSFKLTIGEMAIAGTHLYPHEAIAGFRPKNEDLEREYLYYALPDAAKTVQAHQAVKGATLNKGKLESMRLLAPPLPEQKKIAAILASVDEAIEATEAVIEQTRRVKKGLLEELLTQGIGHTSFKETKIGEIPEAWEVVKVRDLITSIDSGWSPKCEGREAPIGTWGVLKTSAVTWDGYDESEQKMLPSVLEPRPRAEVKEEDVLITRAGPQDRVGVVAYVNATRSKLMLSDKLIRLRADTEKIEPDFLSLALSSTPIQYRWQGICSGLASSQTNISQKTIQNTGIMVPPLSEQQEIASMIGSFSQKIREATKPLMALKHIKKGLLQDLLTGEVRVDIEEAEEAVEKAKESAEAMA